MRTILTGAAAALALAGPAEAKVGLSTQFVDVVIGGLKPGRTYNLREIKGIPYVVKNRGDAEVEVQLEVVEPKEENLKKPYASIPDPSWVQLRPPRHSIPAGGSGFSDVVISVPDDPSLVGKHFQATIWARTLRTGLFSAGVHSRLRFSIGASPEQLEAERREKAMVDLNYDLWPPSLYATGVEPGKTHRLKKKENKSFLLTNRGDKPVELVLSAIAWPQNLPLPDGYARLEALDAVEIEPSRVTVKPLSVQEIRVALKLPKGTNPGKYAAIVQTALPIGTVLSATHRLMIRVAGETSEKREEESAP